MRKLPSLIIQVRGWFECVARRPAVHVILRRIELICDFQTVEHGIDVIANLRLVGVQPVRVLDPLDRAQFIEQHCAALQNRNPAERPADSLPLTGSIWLGFNPLGAPSRAPRQALRRRRRPVDGPRLFAARGRCCILPEGVYALNVVAQLIALGLGHIDGRRACGQIVLTRGADDLRHAL